MCPFINFEPQLQVKQELENNEDNRTTVDDFHVSAMTRSWPTGYSNLQATVDIQTSPNPVHLPADSVQCNDTIGLHYYNNYSCDMITETHTDAFTIPAVYFVFCQ